eukprot:COSAG02_NODE_3423_length_6770_cov_5.903912_8_plen_79_part_00
METVREARPPASRPCDSPAAPWLLRAHRADRKDAVRRRPEPLSGEEHQFQFLVFLLIMIVLGLIILAACTVRFEKHCL